MVFLIIITLIAATVLDEVLQERSRVKEQLKLFTKGRV